MERRINSIFNNIEKITMYCPKCQSPNVNECNELLYRDPNLINSSMFMFCAACGIYFIKQESIDEE